MSVELPIKVNLALSTSGDVSSIFFQARTLYNLNSQLILQMWEVTPLVQSLFYLFYLFRFKTCAPDHLYNLLGFLSSWPFAPLHLAPELALLKLTIVSGITSAHYLSLTLVILSRFPIISNNLNFFIDPVKLGNQFSFFSTYFLDFCL